jgi:AraC-like DNA-binding protein
LPEIDINMVCRRKILARNSKRFELGRVSLPAPAQVARRGCAMMPQLPVAASAAGSVGFSDLSYFSRVFRQRFGMTARDARAAGICRAE